MIRFISTILMLAFTTVASACNVPVFRYALERWRPDACDVVVFHDSSLTESQQSFLNQLEAAAFSNGGPGNINVSSRDVAADMDDSTALLWDELRKQPEITLPHVVVRSTIGGGAKINNWHGSIDNAMKAGLLASPVREALSHRLLTGDAAVWLVLKSHDEDRNNAAVQQLNTQLELLSQEIPLPEGIGLPGSELFSDIPLLMKFSVLEVDADDPQEQFLVELLKGFEPAAVKNGEPLVVPIFGRGRALEVIPAGQVDDGLIEDLALFLCGACSCQVKERNPGFDLLVSTDWEQELFGSAAGEVAPQMVSADNPETEPVLVPIPTGKPDVAEPDVTKLQTPAVENTHRSTVTWIVAGLFLVVMTIFVGRSMKA